MEQNKFTKEAIIINKLSLSSDHVAALNLLYRPIIGENAVNVYFLLQNISCIDEKIIFSHIYNILNISNKTFFESINRLQAVKLIEIVNTQSIYLKTPNDFFAFFSSTFFSSFLRKTVGEKTFEYLKEKLTSKYDSQCSNSELDYDLLAKEFGNTNILTVENKKSTIKDFLIDYDLLNNVKKSLSKKAITYNLKEDEKVDRKLYELTKVYNFTAEEIAKIYVMSLGVDQKLSVEKADEIAIKLANSLAITTKNSEMKQSDSNVSITDFFESKPSEDFLKMLSNSGIISASDKRLIAMLAKNYKMSNGVINVLLHYIIKETKGTLSKNYVEKIASSWDRENITDVETALKYLRLSKKESQTTSRKKDTVLEWMKDTEVQVDDSENNLQDFEEVDLDKVKEKIDSLTSK